MRHEVLLEVDRALFGDRAAHLRTDALVLPLHLEGRGIVQLVLEIHCRYAPLFV